MDSNELLHEYFYWSFINICKKIDLVRNATSSSYLQINTQIDKTRFYIKINANKTNNF